MTVRICSWLADSIRCVLMTPFGDPVDPDVNRIFATVSPVTRACASSTAAPGGVSISSSNAVVRLEASETARTRHDLDVRRRPARQRPLELRTIVGKHQPRPHQVPERTERPVVL